MNFLFVVFVNKANKKGKQYMNYILCKKNFQMFVYVIHQVYCKPCLIIH